MTINEARNSYNSMIESYNKKINEMKQKKDAEISQKKNDPTRFDRFELSEDESTKFIDAQIEKLTQQRDVYAEMRDGVSQYHNMLSELENSSAQADAFKKQAEDMCKIIEIARRISSGDIVPSSDEKKLMEYSKDMYMMAKNMGELNRNKDSEEHESLWDDEEEPKEYMTSEEIGENVEYPGGVAEFVKPEEIVPETAME